MVYYNIAGRKIQSIKGDGRMRRLIYVLVTLMMVSCASVHSGRYGVAVREDGSMAKSGKTPTEGGLVISGDLDKALSNDFYKFMVFTFENKRGSIVKVRDVTPIFGENSHNDNIRITSGEELKVWYDAQMAEKERKEKNRSTLMGAAAVAGGLLAVFTDDTWQDIGIGLLAGGAASMTVDELYKDKRNIERGKVFPESHLMSGEFSIPAGLYERKWIVFNMDRADSYPSQVELEYEVDGREERVVVPLKW